MTPHTRYKYPLGEFLLGEVKEGCRGDHKQVEVVVKGHHRREVREGSIYLPPQAKGQTRPLLDRSRVRVTSA